jgi:hypothetical protein
VVDLGGGGGSTILTTGTKKVYSRQHGGAGVGTIA